MMILYCTGVDFLMFSQVIMTYEGFPTFVTLIALVIMVDSEVEPVHETDCSFQGTLIMTQPINMVINIKYIL